MSVRNYFYGLCPRPLLPLWGRIEASEIGYRMARGAFWSIGGALISRGLMLVASILVARILGLEVFGEYGIIRTTVNMFLVFAGFGLGLTATKYVAEFRDTDPARSGRIMAISGLFAAFTGALVAVGLFVFAPWVAANTINAPHLVVELRIGALILFLNALNGAQTGALAGLEAFKAIAKVNLWVGLASFPLLVGGAYLGGLRGVVLALGANILINWLLNHLALRRESTRYKVPFSYKGCFIEWPILWRFSLPAALAGVMVSPVLWVCNAMLVNQPGGYGQMGLFNAASQWHLAILVVPGVLSQIVLPLLSNLNGENKQAMYRKVLKYNALINGGIALAVAIPIALLSPVIMRSYGTGFEEGALVLVLLSMSSVLMAVNAVIGQSLASKNKMWIGLLFNVLWGVIILFSSLIAIRQGYGAIGLAVAYLCSYILHSIFVSIYAYKRIF
jgi:O-antigen/teichoic acid export membrane protein